MLSSLETWGWSPEFKSGFFVRASWKAVVANDRNTKGEVTQKNTSFSVGPGLTKTGRRCTKYERKKRTKGSESESTEDVMSR